MKSTWSLTSLVVASALGLALGLVAGRWPLMTVLGFMSGTTGIQLNLVVNDRLLSALEANDAEKAGQLLRNHIMTNLVVLRELRGDGSPELEEVLKRRDALIHSTEFERASDSLGKCDQKNPTMSEAPYGDVIASAKGTAT